jgi:hypothetical protein
MQSTQGNNTASRIFSRVGRAAAPPYFLNTTLTILARAAMPISNNLALHASSSQ